VTASAGVACRFRRIGACITMSGIRVQQSWQPRCRISLRVPLLVFLLAVSTSTSVLAAESRVAKGFQTVKPVEVDVGKAVWVTVSFSEKLPLRRMNFSETLLDTMGVYQWPAGHIWSERFIPLDQRWMEIGNVSGATVAVKVRARFAGLNKFAAKSSIPKPWPTRCEAAILTVYLHGKPWLNPLCAAVLSGLLLSSSSVVLYPVLRLRR